MKKFSYFLLALLLLAFPTTALEIENNVNISNNISSWQISNIDNLQLNKELVVLNNTVLFDDVNISFVADYPFRSGKLELLLYRIDDFAVKGRLFPHIYYTISYDGVEEHFFYNNVWYFDSFTVNDGFLSLNYRHI